MTSAELMAHIRARSIGQIDMEGSDDDDDETPEPTPTAEVPDPTETDDLLVDLRNFIAFGTQQQQQRQRKEIKRIYINMQCFFSTCLGYISHYYYYNY